MQDIVPIALFVYARPKHLQRTLASLRANQVPLIYAFSDGPKDSTKQAKVEQVRKILRSIDWCDIIITEHEENLGPGQSILSGVSYVLEQHDTVIVFEDDLVCVPGCYQYLCAALEQYRNIPKVMSVAGWTHPRVTPTDVTNLPYFDGRAENLVWGTWSRSWLGMDTDAKTLMQECAAKGIDIYRYGDDLPIMANREYELGAWDIRWVYHHMLHGGLCLRPPYSMVEHIGFDAEATHATEAGIWASAPLQQCPPIPEVWPEPVENQQCAKLWQQAVRSRPNLIQRVVNKAKRIASRYTPILSRKRPYECSGID